MQIDWWTLALQTINALVLIWLLSRFLFRPVADMIAARQAEARRLLEEAKQREADAEAEKHKAEEQEAALAAARGATLAAAAADAEKQKAQILEIARKEAEKLRAEAAAEIDRARTRSDEMAETRAARLAVDISAKLLERLPEEARIASFVDGLAAGVAALDDRPRAEIGADGAPVRIKAPRELTEAEETMARAALAKALGRDIALVVDVEPELIAGLELETEHAVVRNSLAADLSRIAAELSEPDRT